MTTVTTADGSVTSADGTTIAFTKHGSGPALILVGGAFQHRAFDPRTAELAAELGRHFTIYHYDRRGRGGSTDTAPYAVEREIEDLAALIDDAGGRAFLHGHSSGGLLALAAVEAGLPVLKLSVYEVPVVVGGSRPPVPADMAATIQRALDGGSRSEAVETFLTRSVGVPAEVVAQMKHAPMWSGFEEVAHTLPYDATLSGPFVSGEPLAADAWKAVMVPTLVLNGGAGEPWMAAGADAVAAQLSDARRQTVPDQDHGPAAAALSPVLFEFFG